MRKHFTVYCIEDQKYEKKRYRLNTEKTRFNKVYLFTDQQVIIR